jgi:hypothetical protein
MRLTEHGDGWEIVLDDATLSLVSIDFRTSLTILEGDRSLSVVLESPYEIATEKERVRCDPELVETLVPMLRLLRRSVEGIRIGRSGRLHVAFDQATLLQAGFDERYEAWQVVARASCSCARPAERWPSSEIVGEASDLMPDDLQERYC